MTDCVQQTGRAREQRWNAILADYCHIRELLVSNSQLMDKTGLQLHELNHRTLTQWFVAVCEVFPCLCVC